MSTPEPPAAPPSAANPPTLDEAYAWLRRCTLPEADAHDSAALRVVLAAIEHQAAGAVPDTGDACETCGGAGVEVHGGSSNPDSPDHYAPAEEPCTGCYGSGSRKYREGWDDALAGRGAGPAVPDTGQARGAEHRVIEAGGDPIVAATDLLFEHRHTLPADVLRSMAGIWVCASAAKYGEPYERFWEDDPFAGHDTDECEAENATTPSRALMGTDTTTGGAS